jgi:hypothetical protein
MPFLLPLLLLDRLRAYRSLDVDQLNVFQKHD